MDAVETGIIKLAAILEVAQEQGFKSGPQVLPAKRLMWLSTLYVGVITIGKTSYYCLES